jgi:putative hydrolase of the HAD superfamily
VIFVLYYPEVDLQIVMPKINALFWDVGGVLLTNAWDRAQREIALSIFKLDETEFQDRHEMVVSSFERGKIGIDEYLDRTVFYRPRTFTKEEFCRQMYALSKPHIEVIDLAKKLAQTNRYQMATINNESRELNLYRIHNFGLQDIFSLFVSSCFVGLRKPEIGIYRLALEVTQNPPEQCCFIDDRPLNLEAAARLGMHTIHMRDAAQLEQELGKLGVTC